MNKTNRHKIIKVLINHFFGGTYQNRSYWNYNNLNPKDPVALNLFSQKDLIEALEKAERRIKREKKEKLKQTNHASGQWIN